VLELTGAGSTYQHARYALGAHGKWDFSAQAPQPERVTMKEPLAPDRRFCLHHRRHQTCLTIDEINTGKRLLDLEWAWLFGIGVNMAPVIEAKRNVAVLLNLKHNDVAAQRVNRSGRDENAIAGLGRNT